MKIKMLTTAAGPHSVMLAGQVLSLPDEFAEQLIAGGYATRIDILTAARKAIENTAADLSLRELRSELANNASLSEHFDAAIGQKTPESGFVIQEPTEQVKRGRGRPKEGEKKNA